MMIRRMAILGFVGVLMGGPVSAQMRDYGEVESKSRESFEVGIQGLRLVRNGPEESPQDWLITADVLGQDLDVLGVFEIRFPGEETLEMTYVSVAGETYHASGDEALRTMNFEHIGGDRFTVRSLCDPSQEFQQEFPRTKEAFEEYRRRVRECSEEFEITGTSKTWQEALSDNQEILGLLTAVVTEVRLFFDLPTKELRESRRTKEGQAALQDEVFVPSQLQLCGPGTEQFCNLNFPITLGGEGGCVLFCGKSTCCTEASENADIDCGRITPGIGCCANSFCQVTSAVCGFGFGCSCAVLGYPFDCRATCV